MAWRFRKSVKIIPGVRLNFSSRGVSTSIGVRGAGFNFSNRGVYAYGSIPGTGLSYREKIGGGGSPQEPKYLENPKPKVYSLEPADNIISVDVQQITSQDMQGIKDLILGTHEQRKDLAKSVREVKTSLMMSNIKLISSYLFIIGLVNKKIAERFKADISGQKEVLEALKEQLDNSYVSLEIEFDSSIRPKYERMVEAYKKLTTSRKIWDVTGEYREDRVKTRSVASTVIKKQEVKIGIKGIADIKTEFEPFHLNNANGADMYIYPNFLVVYKGRDQFAIVGYEELKFGFSPTRFVETGSVPPDSKVIDHTWAKVNKNGSRDKRFKGNHQIPIALYGDITLSTKTGLNEGYQFSNYEFAAEFAQAFQEYQKTIVSLKSILAPTED